MGSSNQPDVRVRLSAEGVQEVVNAFQKISDEAVKKGKKAASGIGLITDALSGLKQILPGLTIAGAVAGAIALGKSALEGADGIGKLSQKVGVSASMLSVFSLAATTADVAQDDLGKGLIKLARSQDEAAQGGEKQVNAFRRLHITMQDIKRLDPGQMFLLVSQKIQGVTNGAQRAAIAQDLFGRSGANLIPLMNDLADGGYAKVAAKAERLGLVIDDDLAKSAQRANDDLKDMGNIAKGLVTQFLAGFAPGVADSMEMVSRAVTQKGVNGFRSLGEVAGSAFKVIAFLLVGLGQTVGTITGDIVDSFSTTFSQLITLATGAWEAAKKLATGDTNGAKQAILGAFNNGQGQQDAYEARKKDAYANLYNQLRDGYGDAFGPNSTLGRPEGAGHSNGDIDTADLQKVASARLAFLKAQADQELALAKLRNSLVAQQNERDYRDGLKDTESYFAEKQRLANADYAAELANLERKRQLVAQEPAPDTAAQIKKKQELAAIDGQIQQLVIKHAGENSALDDQLTQHYKQNREALLALEGKLMSAEGDRFGAMEKNLEAELIRLNDEMVKLGVGIDERAAKLAAYKKAAEASIAFQKSQQNANLSLDDLNIEKQRIQTQADTGKISQIEAQGKILNLEGERLTKLREIGAEMERNARLSGDPQAIQAAKDYNAQLDEMDAKLQNTTNAWAYLTDQITTTGRDSITSAFSDIITGSKSFGDAWADIGKSFEKIVANMIAQLISFYLMLLLLRAINPEAADALEAQGPFGKGFASGGYTGRIGRNRIAGVVHGEEYVVRAGPADRYRPFLDAMNAGTMPALASTGGYYGGGYVAPSEGGGVEVNVHNNTGQAVATQERTGADGKRIIEVIVGEIASNIRTGGSVAQALKQTFGVQRQGVNRG